MPQRTDDTLQACRSDVQRWVSDICEESRSLAADDGDRDNLHFLPELVPHLIRLSSYLPLWTGIMVTAFKSQNITASSAHVEAEFKNLKKGLFKHDNLPIRVDCFVAQHLAMTEGSMKLSAATIKNHNKMEVNTMEDNDDRGQQNGRQDNETLLDTDKNEPIENWRGLGVPPKRRKSYLTPCPEWLHKDSAPQQKISIGLMKNGNHLASHPIKLGKMHVAVKNTCAFDSFLQCLCSAFCDSNSFSRYIQQSKSSLFNLVHFIVTKGVNKDAYKQRAKILVEAFSCEPLVSGVNEVNAACNVANIITSTMKEAPSVVLQALCSSPYCSYSLKQTRDVPLVQVHVHTLHTEGMRALQASVEGGLNLPPSKCFRPLQSPGNCPSPLKTEDPSTGIVRCTGVVTHTHI